MTVSWFGVLVSPQYLKGHTHKGSLTVTHARVFVQVVASWTATLEAAEGVDALPTLAQPWKLLALIDVYQKDNKARLQDVNQPRHPKGMRVKTKEKHLPSNITVMGFGRKPSPPGQRIL